MGAEFLENKYYLIITLAFVHWERFFGKFNKKITRAF